MWIGTTACAWRNRSAPTAPVQGVVHRRQDLIDGDLVVVVGIASHARRDVGVAGRNESVSNRHLAPAAFRSHRGP